VIATIEVQAGKNNPQTYKVLEQYKSAGDPKAHGKTDYFIAANQKLAGMLATAPDIEILDRVD
jgi:quinol monooxygenase YgiN